MSQDQKSRSRSEEFDEYLRCLDQVTLARIDARALQLAEDPARRQPAWLADPPDPFGMDWAWTKQRSRKQLGDGMDGLEGDA